MIFWPCFYLNQITTLSLSLAVLHQRCSHGWPEHRQRSSGPAATSTRLVSCVGVYHCFPALLGNISIFQYCPVQRTTQQKEPEEEQLTPDWCQTSRFWTKVCFRKASVTLWGISPWGSLSCHHVPNTNGTCAYYGIMLARKFTVLHNTD